MRGARQSGLQAAICSINLRVLAGTQGRPLRRPRGCDKRAQNINADISIERIAKKGEKSPDFRVYHVTETSRAEIGAGWIEETKDHTRKYVSLGIDDIAFADKFYCRLVKTGAEHGFTLFRDRPKKKDADRKAA